MKGGAFVLKKAVKESIFIPEEFSEEQRMIKEMILDFIEQEVKPNLDLIDSMKDKELMPTLLRKSGNLGMMGVNISEDFGGLDLNMVSTLIFGEAAAHGYSFATAIGAHTSIGSLPIVYYGNDEQKAKYLSGLASGELMASYCLTEPDAGSDANSGKTKAILNEEKTHYIINGQKMWITNGGFADIFIVFAKIDTDEKLTAFIVEKDFGGITLGAEERKLGIKGSSTLQVFFNNTAVPVGNMLGMRQEGFKMALNILNSGRIKIGASAVGGAKLAIQKSAQYALERRQFNTAIADFGAIQKKIADMVVHTYATESATYRIGHQIDVEYERLKQGGLSSEEAKLTAIREFAIECSIAKVYGSDVLCDIADEAIQIHGGMGYAVETGVERGYRDARITKIYEGTNEVNRLLIVAELMKRGFQSKEIALLPALKKAPLKAVLAFLPSKGSGLGERIDNLKNLFLLLTASVGNKFKKELISEQEIIMNLSDILSEIYVLESSYLRAEKIKDTKIRNHEIYDVIVQVQAYEAFNKVSRAAEELVNAYATGIENKFLKKAIHRFIPDYNINCKEKRRSIAKHAYENMGYGLS